MAAESIGVAIQGAGNVSTEHLRAYINNPHTEVVAIGSRTLEGAARKRDQMGLSADCALYDSLADLLANPRVDALSICTPSELHAAETIQAAEAGKHVVIEKPISVDAADLPHIRAAVEAAGVRTVVSFVLRWNPLVETIKALLADGAFGEPFFVQTDYWHNVVQSRYPGGGGYRRHHPMSSFLAGGCHAVDMARFLMGRRRGRGVGLLLRRGAGHTGAQDDGRHRQVCERQDRQGIGRHNAVDALRVQH